MVLRSALGASRTALVTQGLAESLLLAAAGGAAGVLLAQGLVVVVSAVEPGNLPRLGNARIDLAATGFALLCATCAGMLGGVAPAVRSRGSGTPARDGLERVSTAGIGRDRLRSTLVVLEVGMAVVVLAAAALLMRSMANLERIDPGFDPARMLTFSVALPPARYQQPVAIDLFAREIVDRLRQLPGVTFGAAGSTSPVGAADVAVVAPGDSTPGAPPFRPAAVQLITAGYHETWGIRVRRGRTFESNDLAAAPPVAVVNETMARTYWPDRDVVGRQMSVVGNPRPLTIIGVTADVTQGGPASTPAPTFYVPLTQSTRPARSLSFAFRTSSDTRALSAEVRRIVAEADQTLPVFALQPADELLASTVATQRFAMLMAMALGVLALTLAMSGLYALMAYVVSQSSREYRHPDRARRHTPGCRRSRDPPCADARGPGHRARRGRGGRFVETDRVPPLRCSTWRSGHVRPGRPAADRRCVRRRCSACHSRDAGRSHGLPARPLAMYMRHPASQRTPRSMIEIQHLHKRFGDVTAVSGLSFTAPDAAITGLLGANGAGKTTTLGMVTGLLAPDSGTVSIGGTASNGARSAESHRSAPRSSGPVSAPDRPREHRIFRRTTGPSGTSAGTSGHRARRACWGSTQLADRRVEEFSRGERLKVALGRALVHAPQHLVLDEPTNGLDVASVHDLRGLLRRLREEGRCVVFSSHVLDQVAALCDNVVIMARGRLVARGSVEALCSLAGAATLEDAFMTLTSREA